jgi:hypothetical protein
MMSMLGTNISNAVKKQKEAQVQKAEGLFGTMSSYLNSLYAAQASGDKQAEAAAQKNLDLFWVSNAKELKNVGKALNQDWLNPEKTNVWQEGLKRQVQKEDQKAQQEGKKAQAAHGLKAMMQHLIGKATKPQFSPEEQKALGREIQEKALTTTPGLDKESAMALREELRAGEREKEEAQKEKARAEAEEKKETARAKEQEQKETWQREELDMKQKFERQRDQTQNQFHQAMETMKERSAEQRQNTHDMMMMKALGMKLDAQQEKMFKPDPNKLSKEVTDSVTTLRQQLAQANQSLRALKTSASNHWLMGPGKDEISQAQEQVDSLQKAIGHIEKNRDAIIKGKTELGDVVNKAYDIMGGGGGGEVPPPPVPGAIVTKKP